jgi:hypothetical protein
MGINSLGSLGSSYSPVSSKAEIYGKAVGNEHKPADKEGSAVGAATTPSSTIVTLSPNAKLAAAQAMAPSFEDVGHAARAKMDALKQQASEKTHIPANQINVQQAGLLDYSKFSDQELAAMAKNSSKNFSKAEQDAAQGMLADRVKVSVEAFAGPAVAGDWRAHGMAIDALYKTMSPEVRSALGWTPAMLEANNRMVKDDEEKYGKLDMNDLLTSLQSAQDKGGLKLQQAN